MRPIIRKQIFRGWKNSSDTHLVDKGLSFLYSTTGSAANEAGPDTVGSQVTGCAWLNTTWPFAGLKDPRLTVILLFFTLNFTFSIPSFF